MDEGTSEEFCFFKLILFKNLFKPRQLYLQPQNSVLSDQLPSLLFDFYLV